jgi:hypothetical protein
VSDGPGDRPTWNTTPLWILLAVLLVLGTLGAATFVFGVLGVMGGNLLYLLAVGFGGLLAVLAFLFMAGILYRVDRYRGATHRRIELFE